MGLFTSFVFAIVQAFARVYRAAADNKLAFMANSARRPREKSPRPEVATASRDEHGPAQVISLSFFVGLVLFADADQGRYDGTPRQVFAVVLVAANLSTLLADCFEMSFDQLQSFRDKLMLFISPEARAASESIGPLTERFFGSAPRRRRDPSPLSSSGPTIRVGAAASTRPLMARRRDPSIQHRREPRAIGRPRASAATRSWRRHAGRQATQRARGRPETGCARPCARSRTGAAREMLRQRAPHGSSGAESN